jgi:DNA-binding response OmpR family regulator
MHDATNASIERLFGHAAEIMSQILVIDTDGVRGAACVAPLVAAGLRTSFASDLPGARLRLDDAPARLILWSITDLHSAEREFLRALKARPDTRVLVVTATVDTAVLTELCDLGMADYIVRPFTPAQLVHRVHEVLRRPCQPGPVVTLLDGVWSVDMGRREIRKRGVLFAVTPNELKVLEYLVLARSGPASAAALIRHLWGADPAGTVIALSAYIRALRKKLERNPAQPEVLLSERGFGYRLLLDSVTTDSAPI